MKQSVIVEGLKGLAVRPRGNRPGLDALRALAIILVVSSHFSGEYAHFPHNPAWFKFPFFFFGWAGVDLFFVLSGYLIGGQLWRELSRTGTIRVGDFLLRRGMRIWPLYFATIAFVALVFGRIERGVGALLPDVFFISNYSKGIVSGGWSLSTEEQFYILVPILLLFICRHLSQRLQGWVPVILLAYLPLMRWISLNVLGMSYDQLYSPFHTHSDGLVMGLLIAWVSQAMPDRMKPAPLQKILLVPALMVVVGGVTRMLDKQLFAFTSLALIFGGMAIFVLRDEKSFVNRALSWHGFHIVSRLSFGMYLNHFEVLPRVVPALVNGLSPLIGSHALICVIAYALTIAVSMGVALVTFALIEHPFLIWRDRLLAPSAPTAAQVPSTA